MKKVGDVPVVNPPPQSFPPSISASVGVLLTQGIREGVAT